LGMNPNRLESIRKMLPWSAFHTTVFIEVFRVKCPDCGVRVERVPLLPGKALFSKRFEDTVGLACESASACQVARRFGIPASTSGRSVFVIWSAGPKRVGNRHCITWV
jgi:hypothetical protein